MDWNDKEQVAEYNRAYREANKAKIKAAVQGRRKEAIADSNKRYAEKNKDAIKKQKSEYYLKNKEKIRWQLIKKQFGVSRDDYYIMLAEQDCKCAICGTRDPNVGNSSYFAVDHDHETGAVRQLLCTSCNTGIGMLKDSVDILESALEYLRRHKDE